MTRHDLTLVLVAMSAGSACVIGDASNTTETSEVKPPGTRNASGYSDTFFAGGPLDPKNPFFLSLGINGRSCASCHVQSEGWTITPAGLQARFNKSAGMDPVFRTNDGANSPFADVSTLEARKAAYSMLLTKGLVRVGMPIPANAEFRLIAVDDPHGFASAVELSLFRRPLPSMNLPFLSTIMWDGRETRDPTQLTADLTVQSAHATLGHAQATSADPAQMAQIVTFETALFTAQNYDQRAGFLDADGARGGPANLANEEFFLGINDPLGGNPTGDRFDPNAFTLFDAWAAPAEPRTDSRSRRRYAIFRGQQLFNTRSILITGVAGLNDALGVQTLTGTCTTCHDSPNVGNHSLPLPIDIGIADESRRAPGMPLYTLQNIADGQIKKTTDPGRALVTGKWADIGKFKGPILRGLAARPPYFHNGFAATLRDAVLFYDTRFAMGLTAQEIDDLVAFLEVL